MLMNSKNKMISHAACVLVGLLLTAFSTTLYAQVRVADFGAVPNDSKNDLEAIRSAIKHLNTSAVKKLIFEAGVYDLDVDDAAKNTALSISNINNLTFEGAVKANKEPATTLLRHYKFKNNLSAKNILYINNCTNFSLKNIIFDNAPRYSTAGEVVANDGKSITVKIFDGNPVLDGSMFYCANSWDLKSKSLLPVESITYGGDVSSKANEYTWHIEGDPSKRLMKLNSPSAASKVHIGEGLSWHYGFNGVQVLFEKCNNLNVDNVWTYNAIGFCMEAQICENIHASNVKIIAPANQLAVGSRDGWKLYACRGTVVMDNIYMEGVRWDGQNVHGSFVWPHQIISKKKIWFKKKYAAAFPIKAGSKIGFWNGQQEVFRIVDTSYVAKLPGNVGGFMVTFTTPVPDFVNASTLCTVYSWNINSYTLSNSTFKNIAGCASIIRNTNVSILNCKFSNVMYPLLIGAAIEEGEGGIPQNIKITGNYFESSGWMARHNVSGAIAIRTQDVNEKLDYDPAKKDLPLPLTTPYMKNITIKNNIIKNCITGINAAGVNGLVISGNQFINVQEKIKINACLNVVNDQ
jgi:hypothetical protein